MAGKATAYGDYYKNTSTTPEDTNTLVSNTPKDEDTPEMRRKAALRRRLMGKKKAGM